MEAEGRRRQNKFNAMNYSAANEMQHQAKLFQYFQIPRLPPILIKGSSLQKPRWNLRTHSATKS
jgi:hypothetical protein